jgi:suppressor for copper-sensitivity B
VPAWTARQKVCAPFLAVALTIVAQGSALAQSAWVAGDQARVRLVAASSAVGNAGELRLGLQFELKPGWKTYWRSPGDAGYPVTVDWQGSSNLAEARMLWPAPHRFALFGLETFGYSDAVLLPVLARPAKPGQPMALKAHLSYLVCEEICVPYEAELALDLPAGAATPTPEAQLIDRWVALVPGDGRAVGLGLDTFGVEADGTHPVLVATAHSDLAPFAAPDLVIEAPPGYGFGPPEVTVMGSKASFRIAALPPPGAPLLATTPLTVTLVDGTRALETTRRPTPAALGSGGMVAALLAALLGGLILNLMPCVLPVLALKLGNLLGHGGAERVRIRRSFLATAAGVLAAFLLLALALIALKATGMAFGWGLQFQQPVFLAFMALVLTLFAGNLIGWFEVPLPGWLGDLGAREMGRPQSTLGDFATGALATLLATPCSAPFVGTAIGFALARGPVEILAIFAALGLGLGAPYLGVAGFPTLAQRLPRPGRWMVHLRRLLALALIGTAVWLLGILAAELDRASALAIGLLLLVVLGALAVAPRLAGSSRLTARGLLLASALAVLILPAFVERSAGNAAVEADRLWQPFEEARIESLVGEGRTVLVDVTADWCVTCLANKRLVLDSDEVRARLAAGVVAMRADWTNPDPAIQRYLARFERYGIPFNAVYGPGAPEGIALPELLTKDAVLEAFARAGG